MLAINIILVFVLFCLIIYSILSVLLIKQNAVTRLNKYISPDNKYDEKEEDNPSIKVNPRKILNTIGESISKAMLMKKYINKTQTLLIKSGIPLKAEELLSIQIIMLISLSFVLYTLSKSLMIGIFIGFFGWYMPIIMVNIVKNKRYKLFNEQLGDSITLISNSLKSGHSFLQAIDSVAKEMPEPISKEFEKVLREIKLGILTEKALENLLFRVESEDLELMITAVMIQRQIGGNLSEILDNISNTIRDRVRLKGEISALTAQGRLSGIIVSLLPVVLSLLLFLVNPDYLMELFRTTIGLVMISAAITNELIGIILINKIVKIEV